MTTATQTTDMIAGIDVTPRVGCRIKPDGWPFGEQLIEGDSFSALRVLTGSAVIKSLAVRVEVTGRTIQYKNWEQRVRVRITFLGDCEPDTVVHGWMWLNPWA